MGVPFVRHGRSLAGADCVGLAWLFLTEELGVVLGCPKPCQSAQNAVKWDRFLPEKYGDVVFFERAGQVCHVAIHVGGGRLLHAAAPTASRMDNGPRLLTRCGMKIAGVVDAANAEALEELLGRMEIGWSVVAMLVISVALSFASGAIASRSGQSKMQNQTGAYSDDALHTLGSTSVPLPVLFGRARTTGNCVFAQVRDPEADQSYATNAVFSRIIALGTGPIESVVSDDLPMLINGVAYNNSAWNSNTSMSGSVVGFQVNPSQVLPDYGTARMKCVYGLWPGTWSNLPYADWPSRCVELPCFSTYTGTPVNYQAYDIRVDCLRDSPVTALPGCAYLWLTGVGLDKYGQGCNVEVSVKGVLLRDFDASGFLKDTYTENITGYPGYPYRYALAHADVASITSVTDGGAAVPVLSMASQAVEHYWCNRLNGYLDFSTTTNVALVVVYAAYRRAWSQNPVRQIVGLLTDVRWGKGIDQSKLDWASFSAAAAYCDAQITVDTQFSRSTLERWQSNYSMDTYDTLQSHLSQLLNTFQGGLVISEGRLKIIWRQSGASVFSFTPANILADSFTCEQVDRSDKANQVTVIYRDAAMLNVQTEITVDDQVDQASRSGVVGNNGIVSQKVDLKAVGTEFHARATANMFLALNMRTQWTVQLTTNLQGLPLEPGDIVDITHPVQPAWSQKLFWVEVISQDEQGHLTLNCSEYFALS